MSISTDAKLCFGICFDEGFEFPWEYDEPGEWWLTKACGYEDLDTWEIRKRALEKNPMPFEVINHCSCGRTMYILAVPGSESIAYRGYPIEIKPEKMLANYGGDLAAERLETFCKKWFDVEKKPKWWLCSYWG